MSAVQRTVPDARAGSAGAAVQAGPDDDAGTNLRSLLRIVAAEQEAPRRDGSGAVPTPGALPSAQDWSGLIERLQGAARHTREVETQAQEQDQRVQQLLDRVRTDMRGAADRAQLAETRLRDLQARADAEALIADARIRAAEERAEAAEARARLAETWLARVHETVLAEFDGLPEPATP